MKAMILAAGRGERMRPLTDQTPKPLLPVHGKPLIQRHIERLVDAGITELVINLAHLGDQISDYLSDGQQFGATIHYSWESTALETAGGIRKALPLLGDQPFLAINGDIFTDYPFSRLLNEVTTTSLAHLVLVPNPSHNPEGDFHLTDTGKIVSTNPPLTTTARHTFAGIARYHPRLFSDLEEAPLPLAPLLRQWANQGWLTGELHHGQWTDVGTPERLADLNTDHR